MEYHNKSKMQALRTISVITLLLLIMLAASRAQTVLISPTGDGGFELGSTLAANGWTETQSTGSTDNRWYVGTATFTAGSRGCYISNNGGVNNQYTTGTSFSPTTARIQYFWKTVNFPAGQTQITLSFKWRCVGENGTGNDQYDFLRVYVVPATTTITAGSFLPSANIVGAVKYNLQSTYQTVTLTLPASLAGTSQKLAFCWRNDATLGSQPPAAVDEISLTSCAPPSFTVSNDGPVCEGSPLTLSCSFNGATSYSWSGPNGFTSNLQNPVIANFTAANAGVYTCTVTVSGCSGSATTTASVKPIPVTSAAASSSAVCPGSPVNLAANGAVQSSNNSPIAIPDNSPTGVTRTISVPAGITINSHSDLEVVITFSPAHTWAGDVMVRLTSPSSAVTTVFDRPGVPASNYGNSDDLAGPYTFRTTASAVIPETSGSPGGVIPSGSYRPSNATGVAHNWSGLSFPLNAAGTWTLTVSDHATGDVGALASWTLRIKNPTGITYSWTSTPAGFTSSMANPTASPVVNTTYHVSATLDGCTGAASSVSVSINPVPSASASTNAPVCEGDLLSVSASPSGMSYQWTGPSGFTSTAQNPVVTPSATLSRAGTYTVTVTNAFGCTASASTSVVVHQRPVPYLISSTNVSCFEGNDGVAVVGSTGVPPFLFDWGINNGMGTTVTITGLAAGIHTINVTDDNGCTSNPPLNVTITEPSQLLVSASGNNPVCHGLSLNLLSSVTGGTPGYNYQWSGPNGFSSTAANPVRSNITPSDAGMYQVTVTDDNNCQTSASVNISTTNPPTAFISGNMDLCLGNSGVVTLNFTGSGPWTYSVGGSGGPYNGTTNNSSVNISVTPASGGHQEYSLLSISDANCAGSVSGTANAYVSTAPPTSTVQTITAPSGRCSGDIALINVNTVNGQFVKYSWNTGSNSSQVQFSTSSNGPFAAGPFITSTNQVYAQFGTLAAHSSGYNICVKGINGCGVINNKCVFVRGKVSVPNAITGSPVQCSGASGQVYTVNTIPAGTETLVWSFSVPGAVITPLNPPLNSQVSIDFPAFATGTLSVQAGLFCLGSSLSAPRSMIISNTTATPAVPSGPTKVCPGNSYTYSVPMVTGAATYNWTVPANANIVAGAGTNSITVQFNSTPINFVNGIISVNVTSICGALSGTSSRSLSSMVPSTPGSMSGPTTGVCNSTYNYSVPAVSGVTYNWTLPPGASGNSSTNVIAVTFSNSFVNGQVSVTASAAGCAVPSNARTLNVNGMPATPSSISVLFAPCNGGPGQFKTTTVSGATSYTWTVPANGSTIDNGQGSDQVDVTWGMGAGNVTVKANNSCGSSGIRTLYFVPGCRLADNSPAVSSDVASWLLPNPASEKTTLHFYSEKVLTHAITLRDMQGRLIEQIMLDAEIGLNAVDIITSGLSKGIYLIELRSAGHSETLKLMVK
jgi:subtilisin-like proprotein convertase family protein